eukprot:gnl/MRDRNA2_/MRDRNA2_76070_c0_seq2.p1 gnl/MRDRNA2_/MRDRNA2_76070_c0~~gnl/MRDRNA2_/MRDRNA2_76070_c0_seq2.p1  ORF type:complete len:129 (-),score=9.61 gnl/MRDRNA2_/MRDRNA2_76070_c0_seq2:167-517(-)
MRAAAPIREPIETQSRFQYTLPAQSAQHKAYTCACSASRMRGIDAAEIESRSGMATMQLSAIAHAVSAMCRHSYAVIFRMDCWAIASHSGWCGIGKGAIDHDVAARFAGKNFVMDA